MSTHPFTRFDGSRYMSFVSPSAHPKSLPYTLSVRISLSSDAGSTVDESYYLFFATDSPKGQRWHCYMTSTTRLQREKGWMSTLPRFQGWIADAYDIKYVDDYFQEQFARIWKSGTYSSSYRFSDQLTLSVGRHLDVQPRVDTRWCVLSGSSKRDFDMDGSEDEGRADDSDNDSIRAQARRN
jgi:hypothetical protein